MSVSETNINEIDILFVLGAGRLESKRRARYAAEIAKDYDFPIVATGSAPSKWNIFFQRTPEAIYIAKTLIENGISNDRLLLDRRARDTRENFSNSLGLVERIGAEYIGIVTGKSHSDRACRYARKVFPEREIVSYPVPIGKNPAMLAVEGVSWWWEFCSNNRDEFIEELSPQDSEGYETEQ